MTVRNFLTIGFVAGMARGQNVTNSTLQLVPARPLGAEPLPGNLCGLSIEPDRFPDWAGNVTHKNNFTYTLLDTLKQKTGVAPRIRVGGDTQDHIFYTPNVTGDPGFYDVFAAVPNNITTTTQLFPEALFVGAGPNYWLCSGNFPNGTEFTWGVNFGTTNTSEAVAQVRQIEKAFADPHCSGVRVDNIELGNEADFWGDSYRLNNWTIWDYKAQQIEWFNAINSALGYNGRNYRTADWAEDWNSEELLATGIMESVMGPSINMISEHHYQSTTSHSLDPPTHWPGIAADLTNKANIRGNLSQYALSAVYAKKNGIPFVLGETNTFFGHGQPGVSNSAAAALWTIDYSLHAASIGVSGVYFHQGVGYNYSAFVPIDNVGINVTDFDPTAKRHVMPAYYGLLAVADAVGNSDNAFINEVWTDNTSLAAYQIWEGRDLKRLMVLNEEPWTEASNGTRPVMAVNLPDLVGQTNVTYKRLSFSSLSTLTGLTWGGQSWEGYDGLPTGEETFETLDSSGTIMLNASSAALIYI